MFLWKTVIFAPFLQQTFKEEHQFVNHETDGTKIFRIVHRLQNATLISAEGISTKRHVYSISYDQTVKCSLPGWRSDTPP